MSVAHVLDQSQTIIIKIGTALVAEKDGSSVKQDWLKALTQDVGALIKAGKRVAIVSSGGVALGRPALGISPDTPPKNIPLEHKQAASAVGQHHVFHGYHSAFNALGITAAQVLLTMAETENRRMHLNARATLQALLDKGIVPVINENDTISTEEIRFGDNDRLAVRVGQMIGADCVILLSTIDGLYTANPHKDSTAAHIPVIETITADHMAMAGDAVPGLSTGGMKSKMEAASAAMRAGISMIIADGLATHSLRDIGSATTTLFHAQNTSDSQRKKWISAHMKPKGWVMLDGGAVDALRDGKSLLPVGVKTISGNFERGDAVEIKAPDGTTLGVGLTAYSAYDAKQLLGKRSSEIMEILGFAGRKELVHRNDMALTS